MGLTTKVFVSSDANDGFGVISTIIMGKEEAMLVDAQFTIANAHRLVAELIETKKKLTRIFITHLHPDHFLGLEVVKAVWPEAQVIAYKKVADDVNDAYDFKIAYWGNTVLKENGANIKYDVTMIEDDVIYLEGEEIKILGMMSGDCITIAPLWIPSLKTLIASDVVFDNAHVWIADMRNEERQSRWMHDLDVLDELSPEVVIPGHASLNPSLSPSAIGFTRQYIHDFRKQMSKTSNSDELIAQMDRIYPNLPVRICLEYSAKILKDHYVWPGDWPISLRNMPAEL
ncbi:MBL fold metallo-hydrolase [Enterobacteriaceae bacterium ML5]|nr:MBL fold metallo-hydrolase [Enterobacteriaceae bacterium ML5]